MGLHGAAVGAVALPDGEVAVLHGQRRQRGALAPQAGVVVPGEFVEQDVLGPAVGHRVVQADQDDVVVLGEFPHARAQQGRPGEVETAGGEGRGARAQSGHAVASLGGLGRPLPVQRHADRRAHLLDGASLALDEGGAQHLVAGDQVVQGLLPGGAVQSAAHPPAVPEEIGLAGVGGAVQEPQPLLCEGQRQGPVAVDGRHVGGPRDPGAGHDRREAADGGVFEDGAQLHLAAQALGDPGDGHGGEQGVSAEVEEAVVESDPVQAEDVGPHLGDDPLGLVARRGVGGPGGAAGVRGVGQPGAVELAGDADGQRVQDDEVRGDGVLREVAGAPGAQGGAVGGRAGALGGHDVADQAAAGGAVGAGGGLGDLGAGPQHRLDFAEFDAEAADLDLVVAAPEELELPARGPAHDVAGAVEASAGRAERVGHEAVGGQGGHAEVAACHLGAADEEFASDADGHGFAVAVDDVHAPLPQRPADGHGVGGRVVGVVGRGGDGGLGRAVGVADADVGDGGTPRGEGVGRDALAAEDQQPQTAQPGGEPAVEGEGQLRPVGGRHVDDGQAVPLDDLGDLGGQPRFVGPHDDACARGEGGQDLVEGGVEGERGEGQDAVGGGDAEAFAGGGHVRGEGGVLDADGLGTAGGAGGEDDVGQLPRMGPAPGTVGVGGDGAGVEEDGGETVGAGRGRRVGEDAGEAGLSRHVPQALGGKFGVEGHIGAAGAPDALDGGDRPRPPAQQHAHGAAGFDPRLPQGGGQSSGHGVEFGVGDVLVPAAQRDRRGVAGEGEAGRRAGGAVGGAVPVGAGPGEGARSRGKRAEQLPQGGLGGGRHRPYQGDVRLGEGAHGGGVEQGGGVLEQGGDAAVGAQGEVEEDVQRRLGQRRFDQADVQAGHPHRLDRRVEEGERGLRQRVSGQVAGSADGADDEVEGRLGVGEVDGDPAAHPVEQSVEVRGAGEVGAQDDGVHQRADESGGAGPGAFGEGAAHGDVVAARPVSEQHLVGGEQEHVAGGAAGAGVGVDGGDHVGGQVEPDDVAGSVPGARSRAVGRQVQRREPVQPFTPVREHPLQTRPAQALRLGPGEVAVGDGGRGDGVPPVPGGQLLQQHAPGPAVHGDVVHLDEQQVLVGGDAGEDGADRVLRGEVDGTPEEPVVQLLRAADLDALQCDAGRGVDHLHGFAVDGGEPRAQHLVPVHDRRQRAVQPLHVQGPAQPQHQRQHRPGGGTGELVHEPQSALGEGCGADVEAVQGPLRGRSCCHCEPPSRVFQQTAAGGAGLHREEDAAPDADRVAGAGSGGRAAGGLHVP
ncbi:hypothetical protein RKD47_006686 [Streptomyces albogriseolus]